MKDLYEKGIKVSELSKLFDIPISKVYKILHNTGAKILPRGNPLLKKYGTISSSKKNSGIKSQ